MRDLEQHDHYQLNQHMLLSLLCFFIKIIDYILLQLIKCVSKN